MNARHLVIVPHTHWDREWYMPFERFRKRLVTMIDHLLEVLEKDRKFVCFELDGQTIVLDDYLAIRSENRRRLEKLIRQGRILVGPWYVQPDEFLVTGESLIRNLRIGIQSAKKYGKVSLVGYLPDQFGHISQMPQIFAGFNIQSAVLWRGVGDTVSQTEFLWESPDGTRLLTVYLADSYGNGALLPLKPKELSDRLTKLAKRLEPFCSTHCALIMNGVDHLEPQDGLPDQLEKAARSMDGMTFEIGSLGGYINQVKKQAPSLTVHSGEFRSSKRAPLIPGVTSTRIRQKQRAFESCRLLEKYVEPLAAWAILCGDNRPYRNYLEHAWRLLLQNQPHDSICGCSVDTVHEEMETRFDRVDQVGKALQKDALSFLAGQVDCRWAEAQNPALCVFNPTNARLQPVDVEIELEEPDFAHSIKDARGRVLPLQKSVGARELFVQADETPETVRQMVAGMETNEIIGFHINNVFWKKNGDTLQLNLIMGRAPSGNVDFKKRRAELLAVLDNPQLKKVKIKGISGAKTRITLPALNLAPLGLTLFSLSSERADQVSNSLKASARELETSHYRISFNDDGTIDILDKESGIEFKRCLHFIDEGDRGDTYNFDEVPGGVVIEAPTEVAVTVLESGPARVAARIDAKYAIPRHLTAERSARTTAIAETTITTSVSLFEGVKRIDFQVSLENKCEDHRLRVFFKTPFKTRDALVETTFGVARRQAASGSSDGFVERPVGTSPQKCFSCIENGSDGIALFNRGIPEVEALPGEQESVLALTLLRSVGWLSRDDLVCRPLAAGPQFQTPGAQSKGAHVFEFAFTSYRGGYADAEVVNRAHAYAFPPIATLTSCQKGRLKDSASLAMVDNPHIVVSSIELSQQKDAFLVRLYNSIESPQETTASVLGPAKSIYEVDFLEKKIANAPLKMKAKKVQLAFRPAQIKTLQVRVK